MDIILWSPTMGYRRTAKVSNANKIQQFQNIALRKISNVAIFVYNYTEHNDLSIKTAAEEATRFYKIFHARLQTHQNPFITNLSNPNITWQPQASSKKELVP